MARSKLYRVWTAMKERCYREGYIDQHRYKDRGITVCEEWKNSSKSFMEWALKNGWMPGLQIDRKENNKGYYPSNCMFVTNKVNVNNRENTLMVLYNGAFVALNLILEEKGKQKHYHAIYDRIKRGWNEQKAIDWPIKKLKKRNIVARTIV